ncbi:unnamed protein product [Miscanthus lutarioriparius]|uniref:MBD domain-containing protein n=1 Tax=Miscanthus lutarioriparius TaxID=422564 RepID=A0A811RQ75_9POAL|nr:unnamed protein product [Miscanthus lutarioriparius]
MGDKPITTISDEEAKEPTTLDEEEDIEALAEPRIGSSMDGSWRSTTLKMAPLFEYVSQTIGIVLVYDSTRVGNGDKSWWGEDDKMYKFYVHSITGVRLLSKQDVLLYINEAKVSILAKVDFRPSGLPEGWVKEIVYRKTKEGLIRRDPYYTDPASSYTFRTLKSALSFLETGTVSKHAIIQRTSVHDLYSFEISTDMHESLRNRLIVNEKPYQEPTRSSIEQDLNIDDSKDGDTSGGTDSANESE